MMINLANLAAKVIAGAETTRDEAALLMRCKGGDLMELYAAANRIRERYHGNKVDLCSVLNTKSGNCNEDCRFCAQSSKYSTIAEEYPLMESGELLKVAKSAYDKGTRRFCVSTSGKQLGRSDLKSVCNIISDLKRETGLYCCATLGELNLEELKMLKEAGLDRFHHNVETSKKFFPEICTTHTYEERLQTIRFAKEAGLSTCVGVILGMGEKESDWIDMAFEIKELDIDSIPINFLMPIPGTPLENRDLLEPTTALKAVSLFRFINPKKEIRVCGGRSNTLKELNSMLFLAGADGMMTGNYLTMIGRPPEKDIEMIRHLNMDIEEVIL